MFSADIVSPDYIFYVLKNGVVVPTVCGAGSVF